MKQSDAMTPATNVPWKLLVGSVDPSNSVPASGDRSGPSITRLSGFPTSPLPAKQMWPASVPVSITAVIAPAPAPVSAQVSAAPVTEVI